MFRVVLRPLSAGCLMASVVLACLSPNAAGAQSAQRIALQLAGVYVGPTGAAYEGFGAGAGMEVQARLSLPRLWSIGGGVMLSQHALASTYVVSGNASLRGFFVEPRKVMHTWGNRVAAYAAGRVALVSQSIGVSGEDATVSGTLFGGGGGLAVVLGPSSNLDLGVTASLASFGAFEGGGSAGSGRSVSMRIGLTQGIGR